MVRDQEHRLVGEPLNPRSFCLRVQEHAEGCETCRGQILLAVSGRPELLCPEGRQAFAKWERAKAAWGRWQHDGSVVRDPAQARQPERTTTAVCAAEEQV